MGTEYIMLYAYRRPLVFIVHAETKVGGQESGQQGRFQIGQLTIVTHILLQWSAPSSAGGMYTRHYKICLDESKARERFSWLDFFSYTTTRIDNRENMSTARES